MNGVAKAPSNEEKTHGVDPCHCTLVSPIVLHDLPGKRCQARRKRANCPLLLRIKSCFPRLLRAVSGLCAEGEIPEPDNVRALWGQGAPPDVWAQKRRVRSRFPPGEPARARSVSLPGLQLSLSAGGRLETV